MRRLLHASVVLIILMLFLFTTVMAAAPPLLPNTSVSQTGAAGVTNWSADRQLSAIIHPTHIHPTETPRISPTPKMLELEYISPPSCIEMDDQEGGGDDGGGDTLSNVSDMDERSGRYQPKPNEQAGGFGGIGSEMTKDFRIPDCLMKSMFTDLLEEPNLVDLYTRPENDLRHPAHAVLLGVSPGQYEYVDRKNSEGRGFIDYCYDTNPYPYWAWTDVHVVFQTLNAKPEVFRTTLIAQAHGAEIPVFTTTDRLDPDRSYNLTIHIPVRCQQAKDITAVKLNFTQIT